MPNRRMIEKKLLELYHETGANEFFDAPLAGVAAADDSFWETYKRVIGGFHWTPREALREVCPEAAAQSVVCWILPANETVRAANRAEAKFPAAAWARARTFGEKSNEAMRRGLSGFLTDAGFPTTAPHLNADYGLALQRFASSWSERHAAFVAGLGTFGLSAGLITRRGKAMRIGTVVSTLPLEPDARPYGDDPFAWCTRCGACARRCPARAIGATPEARDKAACGDYMGTAVEAQRALRYGFQGPLGCGLCQTGVPCESSLPL